MKEAERKNLIKTIGIFVGVLIVIIGFAVLSQFVGIIGQALYAIVAALFYFVPNKFIEKENGDFKEYGLVIGDWKKGVVWGVGATLITLPFFVVGMWIWEVKFRHQKFNFSEVQDFATSRALYEYAMEHYSAGAIKDASALFEVLSGMTSDDKFSWSLKLHWLAAAENISLEDFMNTIADIKVTEANKTFYISGFTKEAQKLLDNAKEAKGK